MLKADWRSLSIDAMQSFYVKYRGLLVTLVVFKFEDKNTVEAETK